MCPSAWAGILLGGHTGCCWLCLPLVLHWLGRAVRRDKWINHSLLVSLLVWQSPGVPGAGCSLQECCAVEAALGSFPLQEKQEFPCFFGKAVVHSKGTCDTGSYLSRLLGISDLVFLI